VNRPPRSVPSRAEGFQPADSGKRFSWQRISSPSASPCRFHTESRATSVGIGVARWLVSSRGPPIPFARLAPRLAYVGAVR
jgi:hypothetical protein